MRLNRKIRTLLITGLLLLIALLIALSYFSSPSHPAAEIVPHPNGYDDFLAAGKLINPDFPNLKKASLEEIKTYLASNRPALDRARFGLTKQCASPTRYNTNYFLAGSGFVRNTAFAFCVEGREAELEKHPEKAAMAYLSTLKIGNGINHKGILIDALVSIAVRSAALGLFEKLVPQLSGNQCRDILVDLEKINEDTEPFDEILRRDRIFDRVFGLKNQVEYMISKRSFHPEAATENKTRTMYFAQQLRLFRLNQTVAERVFAMDSGKQPSQWSDLVPVYIKAIPNDPVTGKPLPFN